MTTFWNFLAGLGFFLLGMAFLEMGITTLGSRSLRRAIRVHTGSPLRALVVGTTATAILQSSSLVSLLTLAFLGAGVLALPSSLGIVLGANLGTTITGWIVAGIGFKVQLTPAALPLVGLGASAYALLRKETRMSGLASLILGLGLLVFGLENMKESVEGLAAHFEVAALQGFSLPVYALAGFLFTTLIQSSSATTMIVLSALHAHLIQLPEAAALVVGADLGTTITAILGSLGGSAAKKRLALGQFLFNLIVDSIALALLLPWLAAQRHLLPTGDPLLHLVTFHSSFNLFGIMLFFPFLNSFANFLERRFRRGLPAVTRFIHRTDPKVPEAGIEALTAESRALLADVGTWVQRVLAGEAQKAVLAERLQEYNRLKQVSGAMLRYTFRLQEQRLDAPETARLNQLSSCLHSTMLASKSLKDVLHNLAGFAQEDQSPNRTDFQHLLSETKELMASMTALLEAAWPPAHSGSEGAMDRQDCFKALAECKMRQDQLQQQAALRLARLSAASDPDLASFFNLSQELFASSRQFLHALSDLLLEPMQIKDFDSLPLWN
jgi:phosphate:Na+ symporter